ncbi:aminomethyl-transferring glycine dehydrogenase subunit GcvPA [Pontibacillus yanchengensis]|uniref:Aminomethyl-transferring glycine dehydrogenase subunit GcvPA n=2 Tax=Pontibacillus yanchengensis TaxID=462910 RepID=A0ACC7VHF4_9BACI|nr:aminomethyl-transferring glycine dehydrogenase subunit GcvPA [Pontibacillus yanchengensis]MYL33499.1 aminomethyl-transferring glycine dehydrogenase subunit GcvPA [Pontibacillus yanchengensis]MYL53549.1 aminomethyl-transferring glycine dehydrogenase subunit GcvPA [Pontibacillus yanchengensis]
MTFRYLPMTTKDKESMLDAIGVKSTNELFQDIPEAIRYNGDLQIKPALSEPVLMRELSRLANKNINTQQYTSFLGAGVYDHYIPSIVNHVISRSEFYTAYTPYQPEISQGELQAIFEFQTMISELTGMEVSNSSMYDGGTALAEAVTLSAGQTKKKKVIVSKAIHPQSREVIQTYAKGPNLEVIEIDTKDGITDIKALEQELDENTASVVISYPNFYGQVEPLAEVQRLLEDHKAMFIVSSNPLSLGYLTPPGEFGADIVVGDTQVFGIPAQFGGPHCGYFATTSKLMRKVPGRLVGQTKDEEGRRGFVLTLQAREQHIRRDKATSNICSNQALNALATSVALSALGKQGLKEMAYQNMQKARYAFAKLQEAGMKVKFKGAFFNEVVLDCQKSINTINQKLQEKGYIGGFDLESTDPSLSGCMLIAITEMRTKEEIDAFVTELRDIHVE